MRPIAYAAALLLLFALAPEAEAQAAPPRKDVALVGNAFIPNIVEIVKGTTVVWTNQDSVVHTVTNDPSGDKFDDTVLPEEFSASGLHQAEFKFDQTGVTLYHCEIHANMKGEIRVVETLTAPVVNVEAKDDGNNRRFDPNSISINTTQKVNFTNKGQFPHNVVFEDSSVQGGDLPPGKSVTVTVTKEGDFKFRCSLHSADFANGMIGSMKVKSGPAARDLPPDVTIATPSAGDTVNGTVHVSGTVTVGPGQAEATAVEFRAGPSGAWTKTDFDAADGSWMQMWDSTSVGDGTLTLFARAPTEEFAEPTPVAVDVVVKNGQSLSEDGTATPTDGKEDGGGGLPGFGWVLLALAGLAAIALRRPAKP